MTIAVRSLVPAALALPLPVAGGPVRAGDAPAELGDEYVLARAGGTADEAAGRSEGGMP